MGKYKQVNTLPELIKHCGGLTALGRLLDTSPQNVHNWRTAGHIPSQYYKAHRERLKGLDLRVKDSLWGFKRLEAAE
jgi:hypothetical protein